MNQEITVQFLMGTHVGVASSIPSVGCGIFSRQLKDCSLSSLMFLSHSEINKSIYIYFYTFFNKSLKPLIPTLKGFH